MWCGVDIVAVERVKKALIGDTGSRFKKKVFTPGEIDYCESKANNQASDKTKGIYQSYAARFAAKEAFSKAIGKGIGAAVNIGEIEIKNDLLGKPRIEISGQTRNLFDDLGCKSIELSISHETEYAVAFVMIY